MKAVVAAFNQEKAIVGAFSVIVQLYRWCGVGSGYSYPPPAATPLASASASHCHGFIDLFTPTADWRWLLLLRKTPPPPTTSSSPLLAPLISVQATQGTGVMEDTIKTALTELLQRRVPEATEK